MFFSLAGDLKKVHIPMIRRGKRGKSLKLGP